MDRSHSPGSLHSHWLGHLPSLASLASLASPACFPHSKGFIEWYTNISKSVEYLIYLETKSYFGFAKVNKSKIEVNSGKTEVNKNRGSPWSNGQRVGSATGRSVVRIPHSAFFFSVYVYVYEGGFNSNSRIYLYARGTEWTSESIGLSKTTRWMGARERARAHSQAIELTTQVRL